jgi:hypothetical protein
MISGFIAEESIYDLLVAAQDSNEPFINAIDSALKIRNYEPGDFRYDSILEFNDGLYVYLSETDFLTSNGGESDQTHMPDIYIDLYTSSSASQVGTADVVFSPENAHARMKAIIRQVYDVLENTQFKRLLNDQMKTQSGYRAFTCSQVLVTKFKKLATLRLLDSMKTITISRLMVKPEVVEIHNENVGVALNSNRDHVVAFADADDLPDPFPPVP